MVRLRVAVAFLCVMYSVAIENKKERGLMSLRNKIRRLRTTEHQDIFLSTTCDEAGGVQSKLTEAQKKWIIDYHNDHRANEGSSDMEKVSWDDDLACQAQRVVDTCRWGHNDIRASKDGKMLIGQNIVAVYVKPDVTEIDKERMDKLNDYFFDEKKYYEYPDSHCKGEEECNHFRMMMIAKNAKIGGACKICDDQWLKDKGPEKLSPEKGFVAFCVINYIAPLSAISGIKIFEKGEPCSACRLNWAKCEDKLCVKCKEEEEGCKFYDNCKDLSGATTCNFMKTRGLCNSGGKDNCAKTCDAC